MYWFILESKSSYSKKEILWCTSWVNGYNCSIFTLLKYTPLTNTLSKAHKPFNKSSEFYNSKPIILLLSIFVLEIDVIYLTKLSKVYKDFTT